jgi:1-acyl-sn-glycerol-3-phosphate acyltransferase
MAVRILRWLFYRVLVMGLTRLLLGINLRHGERLPQAGPAVVVANHNSHLDAMLLVTLLPGRLLPCIRPVAAADYFLKNRLLAWFALRIIGIIPLRRGGGVDALAAVAEALAQGAVVIYFPEGTRGEPEQLSELKSGLWHLLRRHPEVPIHPVFMAGLGKAMPRGEALIVPFFVDAYAGEPFRWQEDRGAFMADLGDRLDALARKVSAAPWA